MLIIKVPTRAVLPWVDLLIVHELDEMVVPGSDESTQARPDPIDPMVTLKAGTGDARAERAGRVEAGAGVVDACDFGDEEGEADADGCDEGILGFFGGKHKDGEDQQGSEELRTPSLM